MTNYEWLLQMGGEERQAWFDAEHVDANDVSTRKGDVRADGVCANDVDVSQDSREKLEADVYRAADEMEEFTYGEKFINTNKILRWLDRQAAITRRETRQNWQDTPNVLDRTNLQTISELTAERDALADDLLTCNKEREEYRELFSEALTLAVKIVNLQP